MSKDEYLITDAPLKALTVFAMPMILGSFFQQIYNMADSIIVGQFVGSSALAAVGACAALTNVFICVALGAGVGAGVLVSRYFGAREYGKMKTIVSTSLLSFLILSIVLGIFGFCFSRWMMSTLQTPADILDDAVLYLRVYFVGFPFLFMYNILSTMFTSIGESKIPLGLLIFSSVLNIFMDLWMVAGLDLGVFGAALATLIAQGISAVFSLLGAGVGAGVLVSRYFGAREYGKMKTIVSTSLLSFLILSIVLGIFGFCSSRWMMSTLQTPADILDDAVLYLRVYFVGFPFLFMYNILSTMFTSIGESKIPLGLLIFSSVLNIFMDLWMVAGLDLGVFGAALATLIAQGISAVFSLLIFFHRMRRYKSPFALV